MKMKRYILFIFLFASIISVNAQDKVSIYPSANSLKVYVFDGQLKFIKYLPVQAGTTTINAGEFSKNKYFVVVTSASNYYYIGTSQQIAASRKINLVKAAPLPWIGIKDNTKLINSQNQYINIHAHGGLTYSLENDLMGIIRLKLLGFNGFRLVFRSFDTSSNELPGLYIKTKGIPFNKVISGFSDDYIDQYIMPKIKLAKLLGMYVILDHHNMFLNDKNMGDDYETNPTVYNAWLDMWKHLSLKFKDEPAIAIYEVQNEPGSKMSQDFVLKMHNDVIKLIRQNDTKHIIAFGHSWGNITEQFYLEKGIPQDPAHKLIYTMHHYYKPRQPGGGLQQKMADAVRIGQKYKIPIWFGESGFKYDYGQPTQQMIEQWYDFADRNFISTSIWREDDVMGRVNNSTDESFLSAMSIKRRVFLSETNNWNIRCYRRDAADGKNYIITNPNAGTAAHLKINYPIMSSVSFSPDNQSVKITDSKKGFAEIDGNFRSIKVILN